MGIRLSLTLRLTSQGVGKLFDFVQSACFQMELNKLAHKYV